MTWQKLLWWQPALQLLRRVRGNDPTAASATSHWTFSKMHTTQKELADKLSWANVRVKDRYFHFKDRKKLYEIEFVGILENTEEVCVGYRALYGKKILWVRTLDDFFTEKEVDGKKVKRFTKV